MTDARYKDKPLHPTGSDLTPRQQMLLVRVMEECAELQKEAAKILRFGPFNFDPNGDARILNVSRFRRERDDLAQALLELGEPIPQSYAQKE